MHVDHRRRVVRAAPVLRRRTRGRRGVARVRQAGEADVVAHRRLPAGPHAPDGDLARAGDLPRRQRAHLRAAAHERLDRLLARSRRDDQRVRRPAARGQLHRGARHLRADRERVVQLRRRPTSCSTRSTWASRRASMRNIYSPDVCTAQELITDQLAKLHGKNPYAFRREFIKNARGLAVLDKVAQGRQLGTAHAGGHCAGHRGPQRVQGLVRLPRRDRHPAVDGAPQGREGLHRARG